MLRCACSFRPLDPSRDNIGVTTTPGSVKKGGMEMRDMTKSCYCADMVTGGCLDNGENEVGGGVLSFHRWKPSVYVIEHPPYNLTKYLERSR